MLVTCAELHNQYCCARAPLVLVKCFPLELAERRLRNWLRRVDCYFENGSRLASGFRSFSRPPPIRRVRFVLIAFTRRDHSPKSTRLSKGTFVGCFNRYDAGERRRRRSCQIAPLKSRANQIEESRLVSCFAKFRSRRLENTRSPHLSCPQPHRASPSLMRD